MGNELTRVNVESYGEESMNRERLNNDVIVDILRSYTYTEDKEIMVNFILSVDQDTYDYIITHDGDMTELHYSRTPAILLPLFGSPNYPEYADLFDLHNPNTTQDNNIEQCYTNFCSSLDIIGMIRINIPSRIFEMNWLTELYITHSNIIEIPDDIDKLINLEILNIHPGEVKKISKNIGNLKYLKELDLSGNGLEELPKEIGNLSNLKELNLSSNYIKELPKEIGNLYNLEKLLIGSNNIKELPKEIENLSNLKVLGLSNCRIEELPKEIGNLYNLEKLNIFLGIIKELPKEIGNLSNLKELNLSSNYIKELPKEIGNLSKLEVINLYFNPITELPKEIGNLSNLKELNLTRCPITELPREVCSLIPNCKIIPQRLCDNKFNNPNEAIKSLPDVKLDQVDEKCADNIDPKSKEKFYDNDIIVQPAPKNCITLRSLSEWISAGNETNPSTGLKLDQRLIDAVKYLINNNYDFGKQLYDPNDDGRLAYLVDGKLVNMDDGTPVVIKPLPKFEMKFPKGFKKPVVEPSNNEDNTDSEEWAQREQDLWDESNA